jgi:hypothetical protein
MRRDLSDKQWCTIEQALPPNIDRARVRSELEQVVRLRAGLPPEQQRTLRKLQRLLETASPLLPPEARGLEQTCADALRRPELFTLQGGIVRAFEVAGGDLKIVTPRKPKDEALWPKPTGAVIDYFRAASLEILGPKKSPGPDQIKKIVQLYLALIFVETTLAGRSEMSVRADLFDRDGRPVADDKNRKL